MKASIAALLVLVAAACGSSGANPPPAPADAGADAVTQMPVDAAAMSSSFSGSTKPSTHFGVVLEMDAWSALAEKLAWAGVKFLIEPHVRFRGQPGEQATMFFCDPSGNAIEMKAFRDLGRLFAR
jgi:extradiol dioxygenase family protein